MMQITMKQLEEYQEALQNDGLYYCECNGKHKMDIVLEIIQQGFEYKDGLQYDNHRLIVTKNGDIYISCLKGTLEYCEFCGSRLDDDAIMVSREAMGYYGSAMAYQDIVTGYRCTYCGEKVEY